MVQNITFLHRHLAIVGIYPPPYGGVSIHLVRILPYIEEAGIDYVMYNTGPTKIDRANVTNVGWSLSWYFKLLFVSRHKIIHSHTGRWWARIAIGLVGFLRGTKIVYTAHSYSFCEEFLKGNYFRRCIVRFVLKCATRIIAVNETIKGELLRIGIPKEKIALIPAFIPPTSDSSKDKLPVAIKEFCKDKHPILVANGAFILRNNRDVYGLETLVNMVEAIRKAYPNVALIVYLGGMLGSNETLFKRLISRIETNPLKSYILFYRSHEEFYPVLSIADVFLRPTLTDGDALSVREALYFGVPVIASDVVQRPEYVNLFECGNQNAFNTAVIKVLNKLPEYKDKIRRLKFRNPADKLIKAYKNLLYF